MTNATQSVVFFLVPDGIDDDERISGGNVYDRHVRVGLRALGWDVRLLIVAADRPGEASVALAQLPDGALILIDGLVAIAVASAMDANSERLRIVVLAHMVATSLTYPRDLDTLAIERQALGAARRVVATSRWTRSELIARDLAEPDRIVVAYPGTDEANPLSLGSSSGTQLLCVGAVALHKGFDLMLEALRALDGATPWTCTIVGSLAVSPDYAATLSASIHEAGLQSRVRLTGVVTGARLEDVYRSADLLIAPSRTESYGMAVTEALARGIPVVATRVGGLPEAIAANPAGILVPPDDPWALGVVLQRWVRDGNWRSARTAEARASRTLTRHWHRTAAIISSTLSAVAHDEPAPLVSASVASAGRGASGEFEVHE